MDKYKLQSDSVEVVTNGSEMGGTYRRMGGKYRRREHWLRGLCRLSDCPGCHAIGVGPRLRTWRGGPQCSFFLAAPLFWVLFIGGGPILMVSIVFFAVNAVLTMVALVRGRSAAKPLIGCALPILVVAVGWLAYAATMTIVQRSGPPNGPTTAKPH